MAGRPKPIDLHKFPEIKAFAGYLDQETPITSIDIDGYKWCVLRDVRHDNVINDPLIFRKMRVFGFPLPEES